MFWLIKAITAQLLAFVLLANFARGEPGKPVAVRWWGQAMVSIETYWNLQIVIDPFGDKVGYKNPKLAGDLVLATHEHFDHNNVGSVGGDPVVEHGLDSGGKVTLLRRILDRMPNQDRPTWTDADAGAIPSTHAVTVTAIPSWHDDEEGRQRGANAIFAVDVDGVRIVHCGDLGQTKLTKEQLRAVGRVDVLFVPVGGVYTVDGQQAAAIVRQVHPRFVVPIHYKTPALAFDLQPVEPFVAALESDCEIVRAKGNTLAVATAAESDQKPAKTKVVVLHYEAWEPTGEMAQMFARKEAANRESQAVFAPLSIERMNFRPSNGTHTPRWNAEHMMGRELLFFTQIYAGLDPALKPIDLNPAQMPSDFKAAHPDWTGAEEARQMERTRALVRRFGYLLDGIGLDERIRGGRWTMRRLFGQMDRHYAEHTANVKKKFELPDWPKP